MYSFDIAGLRAWFSVTKNKEIFVPACDLLAAAMLLEENSQLIWG
jgi:hypothetical protein